MRYAVRAYPLLYAVFVLFAANTMQGADLRVPEQFTTIQSAIKNANSGDTVLVSPGKYSERLQLAPGITLRSVGDDAPGDVGLKRAETTIIDGGGDGEAPGVTMAAGSTLDGFTITNVGRYDDDLWMEHHETRGENQKHEHIGHFTTPGIGITGLSCTVVNNVVHHNGSTGIGVRGAEDHICEPLIEHNVCFRNMGGGIGAMSACGGRIIENRCFENFYAGIGHNGGNPAVLRNECFGNIRAGIGISEGACPSVRENKCYQNRRAGIGIRTGGETQPVVAENECFENGMAGIGAEDHARPIIRGNHCHHNLMAGIGCRDGAAPLILGNVCEKNKMAGIGCRDGAQAIIQENTSRENEMAGIGVRGKETFATIGHNRCEENKFVAIGLPDGASALIEGNVCSRTGGVPPLVAIKGGSSATLRDNTLRGGGVACVLVEGRAQLVGNRLQQIGDRRGAGVWVWKESTLMAANNSVSGYASGINTVGAEVNITGNSLQNCGVAIRVTDSTSPANVWGNTADALGKSDDHVFVILGRQGIVAENTLAPLSVRHSNRGDPPLVGVRVIRYAALSCFGWLFAAGLLFKQTRGFPRFSHYGRIFTWPTNSLLCLTPSMRWSRTSMLARWRSITTNITLAMWPK